MESSFSCQCTVASLAREVRYLDGEIIIKYGFCKANRQITIDLKYLKKTGNLPLSFSTFSCQISATATYISSGTDSEKAQLTEILITDFYKLFLQSAPKFQISTLFAKGTFFWVGPRVLAFPSANYRNDSLIR